MKQSRSSLDRPIEKHLKDMKASLKNSSRNGHLSIFFVVFAFLILFGIPGLGAETQSDFESWKNMTLESFREYRDKRDREFVRFLKQRWVEFQASKGLVRDTTPKPVRIPTAPSRMPDTPGKKTVVIPQPISPLQAVSTPAQKPLPVPATPKNSRRLGILFHHTPVRVFVAPNMHADPIATINQKSISNFWDTMSRSDYESLLAQVQAEKKRLQLNDWGYYYLLHTIGRNLFAEDLNRAALFTWFTASKSGYESRVGYLDGEIYLLAPARTRLYGIPFLTIQNKRFYALFFDREPVHFNKLFTYKGTYPDADQEMDYRFTRLPRLRTDLQQRKLRFTYDGTIYTVPLLFNKNLVEFLRYYPQTAIDLYFTAGMSDVFTRCLDSGLKPLVQKRTPPEAVNLLLRFTQTAFAYKTDQGQFGREKYLFPEETLYYPFSDCEDRSIFFAKMVEKLIGLKVVGLGYPGHIATAVKLPGQIKGAFVTKDNERFIICDPTYINADIGMAMPRYQGVQPEIIPITTLVRE